MTSLIAATEVLKQDTRGRGRTPVERREALLDEFEQSGASAAKFARLAGIKYATFAYWVQKRRQARTASRATANDATSQIAGGPVRFFEAVVESGGSRSSSSAHGLRVELPGGSRMSIESPLQLQMAAELLALIAQRARTPC